jgi:NTE family protein
MKTTDFTQHSKVVQILDELRNDNIHLKQFSDVIDPAGNQYVELVQEGGGVLGVALVGYTYVLEQMGIRFMSLAGTSAGSINAMMLAGLGDISKPKSEKVVEELVKKDLYDFVDGGRDSKRFIEAILGKASRLRKIWKGLRVVDELFRDLGLNPGDDFLNWLKTFLANNGVENMNDLNASFGKLPAGLSIRPGIDKTLVGLQARLALIAAEINTETKVEFPRMTSLYYANPATVNPAEFVRASMSIPYFFSPMHVKNIPQGKEAKANWEEIVRFNGPVPKEVYFIDGGIMSNFPIDVFHKNNVVPRLPTFGVRLGVNRDKLNKVTNPLSLTGAMFNSLRHLHDFAFILKNPDYRMLIGKIDIGEHDWLNFGISNDDKIDLFVRGTEAAASFLRKFNWKAYKEIRAEMKIPEIYRG